MCSRWLTISHSIWLYLLPSACSEPHAWIELITNFRSGFEHVQGLCDAARNVGPDFLPVASPSNLSPEKSSYQHTSFFSPFQWQHSIASAMALATGQHHLHLGHAESASSYTLSFLQSGSQSGSITSHFDIWSWFIKWSSVQKERWWSLGKAETSTGSG